MPSGTIELAPDLEEESTSMVGKEGDENTRAAKRDCAISTLINPFAAGNASGKKTLFFRRPNPGFEASGCGNGKLCLPPGLANLS